LILRSYPALRPILVGAAVALLAGCSSFNPFSKKEAAPNCPTVSIVDDANRVIVYRPGKGRDLTDIAYEAHFMGYGGSCQYKDKVEKDKKTRYGSVTLVLQPSFLLIPGPATVEPEADLKYFVEISDFFPKPGARKEFTRTVALPANRTALDVTDSELEITIPLTEKRLGPDVHVYVGFVLTPEQLQENRRLPAGRLRT
jgi:hypothetical protein